MSSSADHVAHGASFAEAAAATKTAFVVVASEAAASMSSIESGVGFSASACSGTWGDGAWVEGWGRGGRRGGGEGEGEGARGSTGTRTSISTDELVLRGTCVCTRGCGCGCCGCGCVGGSRGVGVGSAVMGEKL